MFCLCNVLNESALIAYLLRQVIVKISNLMLQSVINRQWVSLEWDQRSQLKHALHAYLVKNNAGCPNFLRNKLAKLLVDIARHDWPHFYPEYITIILQV